MTVQFFDNANFVEYIVLLKRLHRLIRDGKDETVEGEMLRDKMDAPAECLTEEEIEACAAISSDFYGLSTKGQELPSSETFGFRQSVNRYQAARESGDWITALNFIRKMEPYRTPAEIAYIRGSSFMAIGQPELAVDFFKFASDNSPGNDSYRSLWLASLWKTDKITANREASKALATEPKWSPSFLLECGIVAFEAVISGLPAKRTISQISEVFNRLADGIKAQLRDIDQSLLAPTYAYLGFCREEEGDYPGAIDAFNRSIEASPNQGAVLTARGIRLYAENPNSAAIDWERAVNLNVQIPQPYLLLGQHLIQQGRFEESAVLASQAKVLADSETLPFCLELMAISSAMLGDSKEKVSALIEEAIAKAPDDSRLQFNASLLKEANFSTVSGLQYREPSEIKPRRDMGGVSVGTI